MRSPLRHGSDLPPRWMIAVRPGRDARLAVPQSFSGSLEKAIVSIRLGDIPHHDTPEAGKRFAVFNDGFQRLDWDVSGAGCFGVGRNTDYNLGVLVLGVILGPVVPGLEVEGRLGILALDERLNSTEVVVKLNEDSIDRHRTVENVLVCCVRVGALRRSGQKVLFRAVGIRQFAKPVRERRHVFNVGLKIEIKSIHHGISKWPPNLILATDDAPMSMNGGVGAVVVNGGIHMRCASLGRAKCLPDQIGPFFGGGLGLESPFAISSTPDGQDDGFALLLAFGDILSAGSQSALLPGFDHSIP